MPDTSAKPIIFISYSHKDEPEHPHGDEVQWLSFVRTYLQPAVKHGVFDIWVDQHMVGGADWDPTIERRLRECDIFVLLVSANSMASEYIVDKEIRIVRERQAKGDNVHFYPLLLTPTPDAGLNKVKDKNLRPRDAKPFSGFSLHDRMQFMTDAANEIAGIASNVVDLKNASRIRRPAYRPAYVHITGLPETAYERLVGREIQLKRLDNAWADADTNIISLVAEGGAGKSALTNEWLKRLQADSYRGAEVVLGWSFYSQGSKERATAADEFLNWAIEKLGIPLMTPSATGKGEAIAEALMQRRVLMLLDGVEPLQHGPNAQLGQLKDQGVRALLRRFAATPPGEVHGLIVLTSRLAVKDITRWQDGAAPVVDVDRLSNEAGASLLRDNGVWGTDKELKAAAQDFEGHPLALGLLSSFLKETQTGDVRRRDHIRQYFAEGVNARHDHAKRVMESYEREWLAEQHELFAIMRVIGLFDRPANGDCLTALRSKPAITGLTDRLVELNDGEWQRALTRLREVRLLSPLDPTAPDAVDAHPLVREWFGERTKERNATGWELAHARLYEHLSATEEVVAPTLEDLAPLYQAVMHGCLARKHSLALERVFQSRICGRRKKIGELRFYSRKMLGAGGSDLAAISWFFQRPYVSTVSSLSPSEKDFVLADAAYLLDAQGRNQEALPLFRGVVEANERRGRWLNAAIGSSNLALAELAAGQVPSAASVAEKGVGFAEKSGVAFQKMARRAIYGVTLEALGESHKAEEVFKAAERIQLRSNPKARYLYSYQGYCYLDLLLSRRDWSAAYSRAKWIFARVSDTDPLLDRGLARLGLSRAQLGQFYESPTQVIDDMRTVSAQLDEAIDHLRAADLARDVLRGFLVRGAFRRSMGDWDGAARDFDEVEEIAEPGAMRLYLCDVAFERARLALARSQVFTPLSDLIENARSKPQLADQAERSRLNSVAMEQLSIAANYIRVCGYHRRDEELAELQAVLWGERNFADLPPRV